MNTITARLNVVANFTDVLPRGVITLCGDASAEIARLQAQVDALAGANLPDSEIDAIADSIMEPPDTSDSAEEDLDRKLLRRFGRACIRAALAAVGR